MESAVGKSLVRTDARMAEACTISALNFLWSRSLMPAITNGAPLYMIRAARIGAGRKNFFA